MTPVTRARLFAGLATLAALGILACLAVALTWGDVMPEHLARVALDLGLVTVGTMLAFLFAARAPRSLGSLPWALIVLGWGWLGTWAYGFLWVPGACPLVAALLPRAVPSAVQRQAPA